MCFNGADNRWRVECKVKVVYLKRKKSPIALSNNKTHTFLLSLPTCIIPAYFVLQIILAGTIKLLKSSYYYHPSIICMPSQVTANVQMNLLKETVTEWGFAKWSICLHIAELHRQIVGRLHSFTVGHFPPNCDEKATVSR